jgi:DNA-binding MarR family transcriptional regulator
MDANATPLPSDDARALAAALGQVDASHRRLRTRLSQRLGLTVGDLVALVVISDAAECTPKVLATELGLSTGTVTTLIDRLVSSGQARRSPKSGDRRSVLVELTGEGVSTIQTVSGLYVEAITIALESSPQVDNRHVLDSLRHAVRALDGAVRLQSKLQIPA